MVNEVFFEKYKKLLIPQTLEEFCCDNPDFEYKEMLRFIPLEDEYGFIIEYHKCVDGKFTIAPLTFLLKEGFELEPPYFCFDMIYYADNEYDAVEIYRRSLSNFIGENLNKSNNDNIYLYDYTIEMAIAYSKYVIIPMWKNHIREYEKKHGHKYIYKKGATEWL